MTRVLPILTLGLLLTACGGDDSPTAPDTLAPFVEFVTPSPGTDTLFVFEADTATVAFNARDDGGVISSVDVYVGGALVASILAAPYSTVLDLTSISDNRSARVYATASDPSGKTGSTADTLRFVRSLPPDTAAWQLLTPAPAPTAREGHTLSFDPVGQRAILFGGTPRLSVTNANDTWAYNLASDTWDSLATDSISPAPRSKHGAGVGAGLLLVYGGEFVDAVTDSVRQDYALLDLTTRVWDANLFDLTLRPNKGMGSAVSSNRAYFYGGTRDSTGSAHDELFRYDFAGGGWNRLMPSPNLPGARVFGATAVDVEGGRLFLYGGSGGVSLPPAEASNYRLHLASLQWLSTAAPGPPPLADAEVVYDSLNNRMLMWGGRDDAGNRPTEVWEFSLGAQRWRQVPTAGTPPAGRTGHGMVMDGARTRVLLFGGNVQGVGSVNETWELRW